ncbi:feline leukemia virus subgroup C receptor-related protein 2-like [Hylaeus volcanicus]|uniref:feline leukemia virus subgroup C receptor-related protein 2-like n=1 Tax=Hylaeus volcanicus TaxID=313075 RepID=UPI0023B839B7|nr:feline leukemia virus subgroup C receptor-related protein 2-like [Hylaeus volcanicus]
MTEDRDLKEVMCTSYPATIVNGKQKDDRDALDIKVYKRRWLMLGLFILYTATTAFQWIQYSIITNIVSRYYNVSSLAVDMTSMAFMGYYVIFAIPATYVIDRWGLRWSNIIGCGIGCLGSWIKVLSVSPDRFYVTFIGQSLVAIIQSLVLILPGRLAAQWFHSNEVSTATSLSLFGNQLGIALSFLCTPMIVKNHENLDDISDNLAHLFWGVAIIISIAFLLIILLFEDDPKLPPSTTRALQKINQKEESFIEPMKRLFKNKYYLSLCNTYGLNVGVLNAVATLLNQIYLAHFENGEEDAGRIGLAMIIMGLLGSVSFGIILDKTHKYKETTVIVYFLSLLGQIFFAVFTCLEMKWMVYLSAIFLGYFMAGYVALGYEICAEYTYPESEGLAAGILNVTNNVYGIVLVLIFGKLLETHGDIPVHIGLCVVLLVGLIMTVMTKDVQRRQDAKKGAEYKVVNQSDKKSGAN